MKKSSKTPGEKTEPSGQDRGAWHPTRRQFMWLGGSAAVGALAVGRTCFHDLGAPRPWQGKVLAEWEAEVLVAAAGALVPNQPTALSTARADSVGLALARRVDGFLQGLPGPMLLEIHGMFGLIEHGTLLGGHILRFSRLSPENRRDFIETLHGMGSKFELAARGLRDLCLLGWYANPRTWDALGYDGPLLERPAPMPVATGEHAGKYGRLIAQPGEKPRGTL